MISQTVDYALRAIFFLSACNEAPHAVCEIAKATRVPADYLSKILKNLCRAGLVTSQRGPGGGFALTRSPANICIFEIIQAVDPIRCIHRYPVKSTSDTALCSLYQQLDDALAIVEEIFKDSTVADLLEKPGHKSTSCSCTLRQKTVGSASSEIEAHATHQRKGRTDDRND